MIPQAKRPRILAVEAPDGTVYALGDLVREIRPPLSRDRLEGHIKRFDQSGNGDILIYLDLTPEERRQTAGIDYMPWYCIEHVRIVLEARQMAGL